MIRKTNMFKKMTKPLCTLGFIIAGFAVLESSTSSAYGKCICTCMNLVQDYCDIRCQSNRSLDGYDDLAACEKYCNTEQNTNDVKCMYKAYCESYEDDRSVDQKIKAQNNSIAACKKDLNKYGGECRSKGGKCK